MRQTVSVSSTLIRTPRVMQVEGIFDTPPTKKVELTWDVDLPIEDKPWNIGLIVGPSGSGKSTLARQLWPDLVAHQYPWPENKSVLDGFPADASVKDIVRLLSSVGFSSPPSWLRPFNVLSNGEQFRVTMARVLAENKDLAVVDEFTSVVDRTVAQLGSAAIARTVRERGQKFVAVTCHDDVIDWLQPDWVYRPGLGEFAWRVLQPRPPIELEITRVHNSAWQMFKHHHYLSENLHPGATSFVGFWRGIPVAFNAWLQFPSASIKNAWKGSRLVVLPDYQGVGIGRTMEDYTASILAGAGRAVLAVSSHPAVIHGHVGSPLWRMTRAPSMQLAGGKTGPLRKAQAFKGSAAHPAKNTSISDNVASLRLTAGFRFIGPGLPRDEALALLELAP